MEKIGLVAGLMAVIYALYQAIRGFILNRDISATTKKITLLDTIIEAKNGDIIEDEKKVKEASDAYENSKRNLNNGNGQH